MTEQTAKILFARDNGVVIIRLLGDVRYTISATFKEFLETLFHDPQVSNIIVDLSGTSNIDSTNLGLLAKVATHSHKHLHHKSLLVSDNSDVNQLLHSVGFDRVFVLSNHYDMPAAELSELAPEQASREQLAAVLLDAHRTLAGMNETNKAMFADVIRSLEASG